MGSAILGAEALFPVKSLNKTDFQYTGHDHLCANHHKVVPTNGSSPMAPATGSWADGGGSAGEAPLL